MYQAEENEGLWIDLETFCHRNSSRCLNDATLTVLAADGVTVLAEDTTNIQTRQAYVHLGWLSEGATFVQVSRADEVENMGPFELTVRSYGVDVDGPESSSPEMLVRGEAAPE